MPTVSEDRAKELDDAWEAATDTQRLTMNRISWFSDGETTTYIEEKPSKLEVAAAERIADLEAQIAAIKSELESVGLMLAYHDPGVPTVAIRPGQYHLLKKTFEL